MSAERTARGPIAGVALPNLFVVALIAVALSVAVSISGLRVEQMLIIGILVVVAIPLAFRLAQGTFDLFDPAVWFAVSWTIMFVLRPSAMLLTGSFRTSDGVYQVQSGFRDMLELALLGAIGFVIGYALPLGKRIGESLAPLPQVWRAGQATFLAMAIAALGVALYSVFLMQSGGLGAFWLILQGRLESAQVNLDSNSTAYFGGGLLLLFPAAMLLLATGARGGRRGATLLGVLVLSAVIGALGPQGIRSWLIVLVGSPLILWYLTRNTRPRFVTVLIVGMVGLALIVAVGAIRNSDLRSRFGVGGLLSATVTNVGSSWNTFILGWDTEMASLLSLETMVVPSQIPFQYGLATGEVFIQPIPRSLWPDKPRPGDEILTRRYFLEPGVDAAPRQYSPLADFYMDFGLIGGLFGMAGLGVIARGHFHYVRSHASAGTRLFYASTLPFWVVLLRGSIADTAGRMFFVIPPLLLVLWISSRARGTDRIISFASWND